MKSLVDRLPACFPATGESFPTLDTAIGVAALRALRDTSLVFLINGENGRLYARVEARKSGPITWPKIRRYYHGRGASRAGPWRDASNAALNLGRGWE